MKKKTRPISLLLALCMVLGMLPGTVFATGSGMPFTDVKETDWFYDAVRYVYENGMMSGTGSSTFAPDSSTTRGMIVTILHRLEGTPSASGEQFSDVPAAQYYAKAVAWASANGIVSGYGNGCFGPNDPITREQLAAILYRYADYKGYGVSIGKKADLSGYADAASISDWAVSAFQWACGAGIIGGSDGKLTPQGAATRAQTAAMLYRFCESFRAEKITSPTGPVDSHPVTPAPELPDTTSYSVIFDPNGEDVENMPAEQLVANGEYAAEPHSPTRDGYIFEGWYSNERCTIRYDFSSIVSSDLRLYARWRSEKESYIYTPDKEHFKVDEESGISYVDNMLLLFFKSGTTEEMIDDVIQSVDGTIVGVLFGIQHYQVQIEARSMDELETICHELEQLDCVNFASFDLVTEFTEDITPDDPWNDASWNDNNPAGENWWAEAIHLRDAWDYEQEFTHVDIGIVDWGFYTEHDDLKNKISYVSAGNEPHYHGTHVAGIIGAEANNREGISGIVWNCDLLVYDVNIEGDDFDKNYVNSLSHYLSSMALLIEQAEGRRAVVNFSICSKYEMTSQKNRDEIASFCSKYLFSLLDRGYDFVIVESSGNENSEATHWAFLATITQKNCCNTYTESTGITPDDIIKRCVIVGNAQNDGGQTYSRYQGEVGSNYGSRVDIMAPGTDIYSTWVEEVKNGYVGTYKSKLGTSLAAPMVTGVASLVWSINPSLTGVEVRDIIKNSADIPVTGGPNMVNAAAAVEMARARDFELKFVDSKTNSALSCDAVRMQCVAYIGTWDVDADSLPEKKLSLTHEKKYSTASLYGVYGKWGYVITADGYESKAVSFDIGSRNGEATIYLTPIEETPEVPQGIFNLQFVDTSTNEAVSLSTVHVTRDSFNGQADGSEFDLALANGYGQFTAPHGTWVYTFTAEGYQPSTERFNIDGDIYIGTVELTPVAETPEEVTFAGGDGSKYNPYQVSTPEQLNAVRNDLDAHYIQINDIDMSAFGDFEPIGKRYANGSTVGYTAFFGSYNGQGYKISNLNIVKLQWEFVGLFAYVGGGTVNNIVLENAHLSVDLAGTTNSYYQFGLIAGRSSSASDIQNCTVSGEIVITNAKYSLYAGGIVGGGGATACTNNATITIDGTGSFTHCGGIVGYQSGEEMIADCKNYGTINVSSRGYVFCGGIAGTSGGSTTSASAIASISKCVNYGDISVISAAETNCGGIAGRGQYVSYCVNYGDVSGKSVDFQESYTATMSVGGISGEAWAGGVDSGTSRTEFCINLGAVTATGEKAHATRNDEYAGGIVGSTLCYLDDNVLVTNCYNGSLRIEANRYVSDSEAYENQPAGRIYGYYIGYLVDGVEYSIVAENNYSIGDTLVNGEMPTDDLTHDGKNGETITQVEFDAKLAEILAVINGTAS